jgi:alpha-1,6-mannosyltransferase
MAGATQRLAVAWRPPSVPVPEHGPPGLGLGLYWVGLAVLLVAWTRLLTEPSARRVMLAAALWALPVLVGPPLASRDVYSYLAQGEIHARDLAVYDNGPVVLGSAAITAHVDPRWDEVPAPYGPVWVPLAAAAADGSDGDVVVGVFVLRAVATLAVVAMGAAVAALAPASRRARALALTVANPALTLHFLSGAHNDALMLAFLLGGVAVAGTASPALRRTAAGIVLVTLGGAVKASALLGAAWLGWRYASAGHDRRSRVVRLSGAAGLAVATLAAAGLVTGLGAGWVRALANSRGVLTYLSPPSLLIPVLEWLGLPPGAATSFAQVAGVVTLVAVLVWLAVVSRGAPTALGAALLAVAFLVPGTQPWYLLWGLVPLAATHPALRTRTAVGLTALAVYAPLPTGPRLDRAVDGVAWFTLGTAAVGAVALATLVWRATAGPRPVSPPPA